MNFSKNVFYYRLTKKKKKKTVESQNQSTVIKKQILKHNNIFSCFHHLALFKIGQSTIII